MRTADAQKALDRANATPEGPREALVLPDPTGESNRLTTYLRPAILCLGPGKAAAKAQKQAVAALGGVAVAATGRVEPEALVSLTGLSGRLWWGDATEARA